MLGGCFRRNRHRGKFPNFDKSTLMANVSIARRLNITCMRGDSFILEFSFLDECNGEPVDVSQKTFKADVRDGDMDTDPLILAFQNSDFTVDPVDTHKVIMHKAQVDMEVDAGKYRWDMEMFDIPTALKGTIFSGTFKINDDITTQ